MVVNNYRRVLIFVLAICMLCWNRGEAAVPSGVWVGGPTGSPSCGANCAMMWRGRAPSEQPLGGSPVTNRNHKSDWTK